MSFQHRGLECKSRKSRDTWNNSQVWPWNTDWSTAKANRVLPRECISRSKHSLPTTQEKTLESPLDCKDIQPVHPKGYQSWVFIGKIDVETETAIIWLPDAKSWLIGKDPDAGKDWRLEKTGMTEDEMVGRHHWLNGHEFEQAPVVGDRQGGLACCSPWGHRESNMTEQLNWTELKQSYILPCISPCILC